MASKLLTPADRIRELNEISGGIAEMLNHMGQAINALAPSPQSDNENIETRKETFEQESRAAYVAIQAFNARMKRQAYALEEAGIILAKAPVLSATSTREQEQSRPNGPPGRSGQSGVPPAPPAKEVDRITNGGLGNLDVGWLNSRGNKVGVENEAELLQEAKALLEQELERRSATMETG
ncbi:hypothetical protein LTR78_002822 [Recurvomyces mirabilis]|uniref:Mediator of RNA polymerase II transcription subunit 11 n=1 Tax=Recurvomyces mirabilis TaxID=574656 RepID=A0AAE0WSJ2_9PEZI|nr:hypothetical protein LTR78_002822 [Recurvomyces mirabilis]KAK5159445.1 hypothetical protein LTS14_002587 [Recurvomyces mirabilis]